MTKTELVQRIAEDTGQKATQVKRTVEALLGIVSDTLNEGSEIRFHNFGALHPWIQIERMARKPKTGVAVKIPRRVSVKFRPGTKLLKVLNK